MNKVNNIIEDIYVEGYIDSIQLRLNYIDKDFRNIVFNNIIGFIISKKLVAPQYDKKYSTRYSQVTNLISANTKLATISKNQYTSLFINKFTITISFYGIKRYNKLIDDKTMLLLKNISAYLNTTGIIFSISQCDISTDIKCYIDNILVVPYNRNKRKQYNSLGLYDNNGDSIQYYDGTYEIEKFTKDDDYINFTNKDDYKKEIYKRKKNVHKLAYVYDKRKKERDKHKYDIGYELSRFEIKLQNRYFLSNEISINAFLKEINDYKVFYFENIKQKDKFIKKYNKVNNNKQRRELIDELQATIPLIKTKMDKIGTLIRVIDTIKFAADGQFTVMKQEDYLYTLSKFNR